MSTHKTNGFLFFLKFLFIMVIGALIAFWPLLVFKTIFSVAVAMFLTNVVLTGLWIIIVAIITIVKDIKSSNQ